MVKILWETYTYSLVYFQLIELHEHESESVCMFGVLKLNLWDGAFWGSCVRSFNENQWFKFKLSMHRIIKYNTQYNLR